MKVACIACGKKFVLPDAALKLGGIPVQCGACSKVFTAYRPDDPAAPAPLVADPNATTQPGEGGPTGVRTHDREALPPMPPAGPPPASADGLKFDPRAATMPGALPPPAQVEDLKFDPRAATVAGTLPVASEAELARQKPTPKGRLEIVEPAEDPGPRFPTPPALEPPITAPSRTAAPPAPAAAPPAPAAPEPVAPPAPEPDLAPAEADPSNSQVFFGESLGEPEPSEAAASAPGPGAEASVEVGAADAQDPSTSQVFFGKSLGESEAASAGEASGKGWGVDTAATSGFFDASAESDAFLLDELYEDPFVKARRRRRKILLGGLGTLAGIAALLFVFAKVAPAAFDGLIGRHIGIRTAWDPEAIALRDEGRVLLFRDDPESLQAAIERLTVAHEKDPQYPEAATDLAAAHFLLASIVRAEGRAVVDTAGETSAKMRAITDKMKKARGAKFQRMEKQAKALLEELKVLDRKSTEQMEQAGRLNAAGYEIAKTNHALNKRSPVAMTGLALYYGLEDEPGPAETLLENIQTFGANPPLAMLGRSWLSVAGEFSTRRRELALTQLDELIALEPDLLRAQVGKVQALQDLGREEEARAVEAALLEVNPKHPVKTLLRPSPKAPAS